MAKVAQDGNEQEPNSVTLYVKKHKVIIKNGTLVYIHHEKCTKPCPDTDRVVQYIVAEAFVTSKSIVLAETYDGK